MTDKQRPDAPDDRQGRLAAALRENLRRRKMQTRGRRAGQAGADSAGLAVHGPQSDGARAQAILDFWFAPADRAKHGQMRKAWFVKDPSFDAEIRQRFLTDYERAGRGDYDHWATTAQGALALVILLDQFPRNLFRGEARAFATDEQARAIAAHAVAAAFDQPLLPVQRMFLYLPFEHSETLADQHRAVTLMESLPAGTGFPPEARGEAIDYARRHLAIIERFGRFPHRNAALRRPSTAEELAFLQEPDSSF